jgi:hypothetical protein
MAYELTLESLERQCAVHIANRIELRDGERKHLSKVCDDHAVQLTSLGLRAKHVLVAERVEHKVNHLWVPCDLNEPTHT